MKQITHSVHKHIAYVVYLAFAVILVFVGLSIKESFYHERQISGTVIANDVQKLQKIFEDIHKTCRILSFDYPKNPINFLNVQTFTSSEVGSMNLAHPKKWQGPYVEDNLEVQGIAYQVVRTKKGYFITPGDGVTLPNGKKVGSDIPIDENTDISALVQPGQPFNFKGRALAAPLKL